MLGKTLFEAVRGRQAGVVQALLARAKGPDDVDARNDEGQTPLMLASQGSALPIVRLFLKAGASVFAADREGLTALHYAAVQANPLVIDELLAAGADPNAQTRDGRTPLMMLAYGRKGDAVLRILARQDLPVPPDLRLADRDGRTLMDYAAAADLSEVVKAVGEKLAAEGGSGAGGLQTDRFGATALHHAARSGDVETLRTLLAAPGADVNARSDAGETPLLIAAREGEVGALRCLLTADAEPDRTGRSGETPLSEAARLGRIVVVEALLKAGADPNLPMKTGMTALLFAVRERHVDVVRALLAAGADPKAKDTDGRDALTYAAATGHEALTAMLVEAGALD